jgi:CRISPR-associated Csx2 family protein
MKTESGQASDVPHILLTSLGTRAIETTYQLDDRTATAPLTPLALVQLLDPSQRPNRVVAMVTEGAREKTWEPFKNGICKILDFKPQLISIPDGISDMEVRQILEKVAQEIPEGAELTLDVTQGMRHFPFIFYALVLYLTSLRSVQVRGAYYGMIEGTSQDAPKPIIDLQPLLELPEWFHAVRVFRDQGTTSAMAQLLEPLAEKLKQETGALFKAGDKSAGQKSSAQLKQVKDVVELLEKHSFAYESALPLELGKASLHLIDPIEKIADMDTSSLPPLFAELTDTIAGVAQKAAFANPIPRKGKWKQDILLDENELKRQAGMIDLYLDRDQLPLAVGLMREWVVSWAIMLQSNQLQDWLKPDVRQQYERRLGALGALEKDRALGGKVTQKQRDFGNFWNQLTEQLRNALHHHAMREDALEERPKPLESVRHFWNQLKAGKIDLPQLGGGSGRLLLSPQGTRPGVLFSALKVAEPDTCLVICSGASAGSIPVAAEQTEFKGHMKQIELADPHGGFDEIDKAAKQARRDLLDADEVLANMTGGTTLMGLIVQRLVEEAQKLDRTVRRFALIDRRLPVEQDSDPFVQSDCHWLDD